MLAYRAGCLPPLNAAQPFDAICIGWNADRPVQPLNASDLDALAVDPQLPICTSGMSAERDTFRLLMDQIEAQLVSDAGPQR